MQRNFFSDSQEIRISCVDKNAKIFCTINDSLQMMYTAPIVLKENTKLSFFAAWDDARSFDVEANFYKLPKDRTVQLISTPNKAYTAGGANSLVDGLRGTPNWRVGGWQGYQGQDFEGIVIFNTSKKISGINITFLEDQRSWIFYPTNVIVYGSDDGKNFKEIYQEKIEVVRQDEKNTVQKITVSKEGISKIKAAKYIKVKAINYGKLPDWHPGAGGDAFIFIDEIEVK